MYLPSTIPDGPPKKPYSLFALFAGKAYAIFALLFGFTFYVQYENRRRSGKDFGPRFLWRLALLAGFATINAAFFPQEMSYCCFP